MNADGELRYCIVAALDLLGFSNHLEISNYDLRTKIGKEAITRLQSIESAMQLLEAEKNCAPEFYPKSLFIRRINDTLVLCLDLPKIFLPQIGSVVRSGFSVFEMEEYFGLSKFETVDEALYSYSRELIKSVHELILFIGVVSRIHLSISHKESESSFPGLKTIISTGYRLPFSVNGQDDFMSANFAFSNAYIAEQSLRGGKFYVDSNILQILACDRFCLNMIKRSQYFYVQSAFDAFQEIREPLERSSRVHEGEVVPVKLFRRDYWFREINPRGLSFIQLIPKLRPYLEEKESYTYPKVFSKIFENIKLSPTREDIQHGQGMNFIVSFTLDDDISALYELVLTGQSQILGKKRAEEMKNYILPSKSDI